MSFVKATEELRPMIVVVEGPDGSGKSTLIEYFKKNLGPTIAYQAGEGPEKYPGEINERLNRYGSWYYFNGVVIFDRHPCVSQPIYGKLRDNTPVDPEHQLNFMLSRPVFIYCRKTRLDLSEHVEKEYDSEEHMIAVRNNQAIIIAAYELWAQRNAHIYYRIDDDMGRIANMLRGLIAHGS
jgi:hypothetical protein